MSEQNGNDFISEEQRAQIEQLREQLKNILPPDLDTDLNLYRWIHGWSGKLDEASSRLQTYIENRRAANLDDPDLPDHYLTHPTIQSFGLYFSGTPIPQAINPYDNTVVVVERLENIDFHRMATIMTCGNFLSLFFTMCERAFRAILKQEKETGRPSGLTIIYDLANFPIWKYLNPNAEIHKIHSLCLHLLQDYYCDMMHKIYIVNAPTMVSIILEIVKKFLNPMTQEKIIVVPDEETLLKNVHPSAVPRSFGGTLAFDEEQLRQFEVAKVNVDLMTNSYIPRAVTDADHFVPEQFPFPTVIEYLKPKQKFEVPLQTAKKDGQLRWQFWVSSDVEFGVWKVDESTYDKGLIV